MLFASSDRAQLADTFKHTHTLPLLFLPSPPSHIKPNQSKPKYLSHYHSSSPLRFSHHITTRHSKTHHTTPHHITSHHITSPPHHHHTTSPSHHITITSHHHHISSHDIKSHHITSPSHLTTPNNLSGYLFPLQIPHFSQEQLHRWWGDSRSKYRTVRHTFSLAELNIQVRVYFLL